MADGKAGECPGDLDHAAEDHDGRHHSSAREAISPPAGDEGFARGPFYCFFLYLVRVLAIILFEVRFFFFRRVPSSGPVALASNHQSMLDPVLVGMVFDRALSFLARETLFKGPFGWLIGNLRAFPVPRESTAPRRALEVCVRILEEGHSLLLFPEGTRSYDGCLQPLKRGVVLLAKRSKAPVVPVLVHGAYRMWPRTRAFPRPGQVRIFFGFPLYFDPKECPDSFVDRLADRYRGLAIEAGATEVLGGEPFLSSAVDGNRSSSHTTQRPDPIQRSIQRSIRRFDGSLSTVEA